jgi:3-hydroxyacyl-CoA dehydrogenase/enoyl-CoA hydratase/3-hydroxybutyryl-CoA epimerase
MTELPDLRQFRISVTDDGIVHLVFDMPDRSMNVFSNAAIHELGIFSRWLTKAPVRGVVVSSGKRSAFCAGADLGELGIAYDMIMAAPEAERNQVAFNHFFPLSQAIRGLETSGKPVAAAIGGLALGGGCELALGAHYRVLADDPAVAMGLPESLVGLLPGAGGTQRLPRVIGLEASLPILLAGTRLSGGAALAAGLANKLVAPGEEVAAAERWVRTAPPAIQPWDRPNWQPADLPRCASIIEAARERILAETLGHYPAPLAILECLKLGYAQLFDIAIELEMHIFSTLIQRREPRNMIRALFRAKLEHDKQRKTGGVSAAAQEAADALGGRLWEGADAALLAALSRAGFRRVGLPPATFDGSIAGKHYWIDMAPATAAKQAVRQRLAQLQDAADTFRARLTEEERRIADHLLVTRHGVPEYLGGLLGN